MRKSFWLFKRNVWRFVEGKTKVNRPSNLEEILVHSLESDALSKDLKKRGMSFVGSTIIYAFMQAIGMVDDHMEGCFRAKIIQNR